MHRLVPGASRRILVFVAAADVSLGLTLTLASVVLALWLWLKPGSSEAQVEPSLRSSAEGAADGT